MKSNNQSITQFKLTPDARAGVFIINMQHKHVQEHDISKPHRDNHCQLMLATSGKFKLTIDFKNSEFNTPTLICVFPEQVHNIVEVNSPKGWTVSFDPSLIDKELLQLMETNMKSPIALEPNSDLFNQSTALMQMIEELQSAAPANTFTGKAIHGLLTAFLNLVIGTISTPLSSGPEKMSRGILIRDAFTKLLKQHFKTWKQPAQYAASLSISAAHLNDSIKTLTGNPVSVHIQEASILEAKRLLYFTDHSVKQIAHEVGYDEPVYFGKLFKKVTKSTPLEFRKHFRH